jgi:hypothetical protein
MHSEMRICLAKEDSAEFIEALCGQERYGGENLFINKIKRPFLPFVNECKEFNHREVDENKILICFSLASEGCSNQENGAATI